LYNQALAQGWFQQQQQMGGGFEGPWSTLLSAGNATADNSSGYVNVPGHGPVGYGD
jgi:hypothetical protein